MSRAPCLPRIFTLSVLAFAAIAVPRSRAEEKPAPAVPNSDCLDCHEAEFKSRKKGLPKEWVGVRPAEFAKSVHGKLNCVDCHATIKEMEHPHDLPPAQCAS